MLTTAKTDYVKPKKWDKLGDQLEDFIRSHMNQNGQITKSLSELFREFAETHNTTVGSTSFYYYNSGLKERIFGSNEPNNTDESNNTEEINADNNSEELNIDGEIERLIKYIKDNFNIDVSVDSASIIKEMVKEVGVVSTLLAINGVIEDYDKLDMSFIIVKEAKSRL
jgi:hypothetical protein